MKNMISKTVLAGLALACAALSAGTALAAGDAANGLSLARQWCSSCHTVEAGGTAVDKAPSFASIAARRDGKWIKAWLTNPHPPMEGIALSNAQINDLTAYIKSLAPKTVAPPSH